MKLNNIVAIIIESEILQNCLHSYLTYIIFNYGNLRIAAVNYVINNLR